MCDLGGHPCHWLLASAETLSKCECPPNSLPHHIAGVLFTPPWPMAETAVSHLAGLWERRGKLQPHSKRRQHCWASLTCAVIWQTQHGPAASTNLWLLVLDVVPLSDISNSARKILQPKLETGAQKLLQSPENGVTSNFYFVLLLLVHFLNMMQEVHLWEICELESSSVWPDTAQRVGCLYNVTGKTLGHGLVTEWANCICFL